MGGSAHSELGPPTSIINQENALWACPQAGLVGTFSQLRFPRPNGSRYVILDLWVDSPWEMYTKYSAYQTFTLQFITVARL